jgi:hypothetical protein
MINRVRGSHGSMEKGSRYEFYAAEELIFFGTIWSHPPFVDIV